MKIITCASYYGCGSSAITDLVSEFKSVESLGDYEFRFLHDIDGVSDLEYHLIECPNRHNSGHALKRFYKLSRFNAGKWFNARYEPYFSDKYMEFTNEYISNLTRFKYRSSWFYDFYDKGVLFYYLILGLNKIFDKIPFISWRFLNNEYTYGTILDQDNFLRYTRDYVHKLLTYGNKSNSKYLLIDQLMPSSNLNRCLRYMQDQTFVFVVDRDPRDLYIMGKYVWRNQNIMPVDDIEIFCQWIKFTRECNRKEINKNETVLKVQFEDLVYRYEITKDKILNFVGLADNDHIIPFEKFNPQRSLVNTNTWHNYPESESQIKYIEDHLQVYLYDFDSVLENSIPGVNIDTCIKF